MKKRLISLLLVLTVILSCGATTFAADLSSTTGSVLSLDQSMAALKVGESTLLTATLDGVAVSDINWSSTNAGVASVSNGMVTGLSLGMVTVTATSSSTGLSASCTVHVIRKGIDVARYQTDIDWDAVKASGIDFALIRTGYGGEAWDKQTDPYFVQNYDNAVRVGIKVGAYHYSYATTVEMASQEADLCLHILDGRKMDYPVYYDIEEQRTLDGQLLANIVTTFCSKLQAAGYRVGIYSSPSFFNSNLSSPSLDIYEKWVAHWGVDSPRYSKPFTVWQYGYETIPGISGMTDADYSYKDYTSINPLKSDTVTPYTFGTNSTYVYKITTALPTAPVAVSTNPSAVSVAFYQKVAGGYLYKITNVNAGTALINTTASDGTSTSFMATGKAKGVVSDTTAPFTMKLGATYQFKLTLVGGATATPFVTTGNGSVLNVVSTVKSGNSFLVTIRAKGAGCTSVYTTMPGQQAIRQCTVTVSSGTTSTAPSTGTGTAATGVISDTTAPFTTTVGATYQFKFTLVGGTAGTPIITTGNGSVLNVISTVKSGTSFYVKVGAKGAGCTSVYTTLPGQQAVRQCMVTVA